MAKKMKANTSESPISASVTSSDTLNDKQQDSETSMGEQVSGIVDSAKQASAQALDQAKEQATSHADQQRQTLASGMQAVARAFQSMGEDLRNKDEGPVAKYAAEIGQAIGGQVEQFANYVRDRDVRQLISDTEDFARRSPAVFLGSAFVLGLAASRFFKSSRPALGGPATGSSNRDANTADTQLLLPPAAPSPASTESGLPSGFPFDPPAPRETELRSTLNRTPSMSTGTDPVGT